MSQGCRPQGATSSLGCTAGQLLFVNIIICYGKGTNEKNQLSKEVTFFSPKF